MFLTMGGGYDRADLFNHNEVSTAKLYTKAKELVAAVKEKVDEWLAENNV